MAEVRIEDREQGRALLDDASASMGVSVNAPMPSSCSNACSRTRSSVTVHQSTPGDVLVSAASCEPHDAGDVKHEWHESTAELAHGRSSVALAG